MHVQFLLPCIFFPFLIFQCMSPRFYDPPYWLGTQVLCGMSVVCYLLVHACKKSSTSGACVAVIGTVIVEVVLHDSTICCRTTIVRNGVDHVIENVLLVLLAVEASIMTALSVLRVLQRLCC